ncbi:MAG: LytTR family transcriptional regulator DNA-binding domain-containing protein [Ruminococcus sp.]|jgi:DNA-binding LytR/AlgR family response regulator|nr:LytTR family transcriptional regulator DNA-binding domain-containing protein [Ruminococcus sp.]
MKIIIENIAPDEEETCILRVRSLTDNTVKAVNLLKCPDSLTVFSDGESFILDTKEVYYAESVDLKTFIYTKEKVYQSRLKLYEAEEILSSGDFLRISKQTLVNVSKIKSVSPAGGGRFIAELDNKEKVIISRSYVSSLKRRFGI